MEGIGSAPKVLLKTPGCVTPGPIPAAARMPGSAGPPCKLLMSFPAAMFAVINHGRFVLSIISAPKAYSGRYGDIVALVL